MFTGLALNIPTGLRKILCCYILPNCVHFSPQFLFSKQYSVNDFLLRFSLTTKHTHHIFSVGIVCSGSHAGASQRVCVCVRACVCVCVCVCVCLPLYDWREYMSDCTWHHEIFFVQYL